MDLSNMTLEEVVARLSELEEEVRNSEDVEAVNKATEEKRALLERKAELEALEQRKADAEALNNGSAEPDKIVEKHEERKEEKVMEYRNLWLKNLQGTLNEEERAAYSTLANADAIVPEEIQADIISKAKEYAPILNDVTLLNVNGAVKFAVEGDNASAAKHTELATITAASDSMVEVVLSAFEITKLIQISASVKSMALPTFEAWLVASLAEAIAIKLENLVFNGSGTGEATGILTTVTEADAVANTISADNILKLIGSLKSGYARNGKLVVNRKTFFTQILALQLSVNNEVVKVATGEATGEYRVLGVDVRFTDSISDGVVIYGDFRKYVANLASPQQVVSQFDIDTNSYKYLGAAVFDGKVALAEAFKTIQPATTTA
jgi:HK97 family phage major capsid protein